jgi:hypothetical protein
MRAMALSLGAAVVLGAAILWTPALRASTGEDETVGAPRPPSVSPVAPADIAPSHAVSFIRFGPDAVDATATPKPAPPALVGLIGSGPRRIAYVLIGGQTVRAGLWDKVGAWRLTAIGPRGVTLSAGRRALELSFYGPRPQPPSPTPIQEAAAGGPPPPVAATPSPPAPPMHALEPASAPQPRSSGGHRPLYWAGPPGSAPPGYILLKPGETPPP